MANKYLLDTHILIWWFQDSEKLSDYFVDIIANPKNIKYVSVATIWEIVIKVQNGKLVLNKSMDFLLGNLFEFEILDIKMEHVLGLMVLSNIHKDPFDRIIISQAKVEGLILLTSDKTVVKYFEK